MAFSVQRTAASVLFIFVFVSLAHAVGQSAVITLTFPPGARATALGEAFVGLADDVNATFFNPAGLGQSPLSSSWKVYLERNNITCTSIASRKRRAFGSKELVYVGTNKGIYRFNGAKWENFDNYTIQSGDDIQSIAEQFLSVQSESLVRQAILQILAYNGLEQKRLLAVLKILRNEIIDSTIKSDTLNLALLGADLIQIPATTLRIDDITQKLATKIDTLRTKEIAASIDSALSLPDAEFSNAIELKIPFSIAVHDSVTTMALDQVDRLWVGTMHGLWRFDGTTWSWLGEKSGLPSDEITTIAVSNTQIGVGTSRGVALITDSAIVLLDSASGVPQGPISAIAFGSGDELFIGTQNGLIDKKDSSITILDTTSGLLSNKINALYFDSRQKLWIGCDGGVVIYNAKSLKPFAFRQSIVCSFAESHPGKMWIGTNRGAISYTEGRSKIDANGSVVENPPTWKAYHSKNALKGDLVRSISVHGSDIYLVTEKAVNRYDAGETQVGFFYEQVLPGIIDDIWHAYAAAVFPTEEFGTFGGFFNFINFGENEWTDEFGKYIGKSRSYEFVLALSYGLGLTEDFSVGLNFKYMYSALAPIAGIDGIGQDFCFDVALLKRNLLLKGFDLGFNLQNMGPPISYIDAQQKDALPFTANLGLVYRAVSSHSSDLKFLLDFGREIVYIDTTTGQPDNFFKAIGHDLNSGPWQKEFLPINIKAGLEYMYAEFIAVRTGFLFDREGERYEWTWGLGVKYSNLNTDFSYIYSPEGFMKRAVGDNEGSHGVRNGQWRASLIIKL